MTSRIEAQKTPPHLVIDAFVKLAEKYPIRVVTTSSDVLIAHKAEFNGVTVTSAPSPADGPAANDYTPEVVRHAAEQTSATEAPPDATPTPPRPTMTTEVYALSPYEITVYGDDPTPQQVADEVEKLFRPFFLPVLNQDEQVVAVVGHDIVVRSCGVNPDGKPTVKSTTMQFYAALGTLPNIPHALPLLILHRLSGHCHDYQTMAGEVGNADTTPERFRKQCATTNMLMHLANPDLKAIHVPLDFGGPEMSKFLTSIFNLFMAIGHAVDPRVRVRPAV